MPQSALGLPLLGIRSSGVLTVKDQSVCVRLVKPSLQAGWFVHRPLTLIDTMAMSFCRFAHILEMLLFCSHIIRCYELCNCLVLFMCSICSLWSGQHLCNADVRLCFFGQPYRWRRLLAKFSLPQWIINSITQSDTFLYMLDL